MFLPSEFVCVNYLHFMFHKSLYQTELLLLLRKKVNLCSTELKTSTLQYESVSSKRKVLMSCQQEWRFKWLLFFSLGNEKKKIIMAPKEEGREERRLLWHPFGRGPPHPQLSFNNSSSSCISDYIDQEMWQLDFFCWVFSIVLGTDGATGSSSLAVAGSFLAEIEKCATLLKHKFAFAHI